MSRYSLRTAILLVALSLVAACGSADSGLKEVTIGSQQVEADAGLFLADSLGYFKQEGLKVNFTRMTDAASITNSLATGHLDVAGATITPGTFQAAVQGLDVKLVGDKNFMAPPKDGLPAMSGTRLAVRPEFDKGNLAATLAALRGKKLAIHSNLSIQIVYLTMLLQKYGFKPSDFQITPVLSPSQTAALKNGAIDAAVMQEPYFSQAINSGLAKPVSDMTEELPPNGVSTTALLYGKKLLEDRPTANKFMVAYLKGVRAYNDAMFYGKDKDRVVSTIAKAMKVPTDEISKSYPPGLDPNQEIDLGWMAACEKSYRQSGTLDRDVDPSKIVDSSYRDAAIKELGQYAPPKP